MVALSSMAVLVLAAQTAGATAQTSSDADARRRTIQAAAEKREEIPIVQVGLFSYRPDGTVQGAAYETNVSSESFQYVAGCRIGAGNRPVPDGATDAWRLSGKVVSVTPNEAVVQLDWQRVRAGGVAVGAPGGSIQLTLHPGDRVPLDSANADSTALCPARTVGFEARYGPRDLAGFGFNSTGGGRGSGGGGGGGRAAGTGSGGGLSGAGGAVSGLGRAVHVPKDPFDNGSGQFDVDLWLVHSAPGKKEETLHQMLAGVRGSAQFAFPPMTLEDTRAAVNLQVTGVLRFTTDDTGARQLVFITTRNAKFSPVGGAARDLLPSTQGVSTTTHPMPGPDDVLSFELPPIRVPNSGVTIPDQFAVRVRIR